MAGLVASAVDTAHGRRGAGDRRGLSTSSPRRAGAGRARRRQRRQRRRRAVRLGRPVWFSSALGADAEATCIRSQTCTPRSPLAVEPALARAHGVATPNSTPTARPPTTSTSAGSQHLRPCADLRHLVVACRSARWRRPSTPAPTTCWRWLHRPRRALVRTTSTCGRRSPARDPRSWRRRAMVALADVVKASDEDLEGLYRRPRRAGGGCPPADARPARVRGDTRGSSARPGGLAAASPSRSPRRPARSSTRSARVTRSAQRWSTRLATGLRRHPGSRHPGRAGRRRAARRAGTGRARRCDHGVPRPAPTRRTHASSAELLSGRRRPRRVAADEADQPVTAPTRRPAPAPAAVLARAAHHLLDRLACPRASRHRKSASSVGG